MTASPAGSSLAPTAERARTLTPPALAALAREVGEAIHGEAHFDRGARLLYATDASIYQMEPLGVVFPHDAEDVQAVVRIAALHGVPVLPRGAGTSLAGQAVNHAIVLDFSRSMARVLEIDPERRLARVQPGVVLAALNREAAAFGLQYAIDPSTADRATIGGGIGNNSCGARSVLYGKTLDQVVSLEVVLADGTRATFRRFEGAELEPKLALDTLEGAAYRAVRRIAARERDEIAARFPRIQRRVSGYNLDEFTEAESSGAMDLARMIVGSEGTLAVVTEATVRLVPRPAYRGVAAIHFYSLFEAAEATSPLLAYRPDAIELVDATIVRRCRANPAMAPLAAFVEGDPAALLLVEVSGDSRQGVEVRLARIAKAMQDTSTGYATVVTADAAEQARIWRMRQAGLGLIMNVPTDAKPVALVEDTAVPPERLGEFVQRFDALVRSEGTEAAYYGHASVGCLHIRPLVNVKDAAGLASMRRIADQVAALVLEFGGSLSGEHGDGILRGVYTERMFGPRLTEAFREVKRAFDPYGLLNPGKIVDTPPFESNLRLSPSTRNFEPPTYLDFTAQGGFARAIEQCNGQGACRKMDGGMCPSFMATQDEEHSTRGRANLLRMAISGVLPREALTGPRVFDALDLCVECKACKAECPSGVDMAKLKYEVLTRYHEEHGAPLRARLFAHIAALSRLGSAGAPLSNLAAGVRPARWLMHRFLGIHRERRLPRFQRREFRRWFAKRPAAAGLAPRGDAVLFDDTFTRYHHPEVGQAATRVLEALGYRVVLAERMGCCGRPAISKGMLGTASRWARRNVDALLPFAERGVPIVGTEPSCLLSLRDEYPDLLRDAASRMVAGQALLLDGWVARLAETEPEVVRALFAEPRESRRAIRLHGHCHQKAIAGIEPTLATLRLAGYDAQLIDSACCGMAGSFGFEAEHYEVSRAMGALKLFPAVESAPPEARIAITGVSCRQQIGHFTAREPLHSAELLAEALRG